MECPRFPPNRALRHFATFMTYILYCQQKHYSQSCQNHVKTSQKRIQHNRMVALTSGPRSEYHPARAITI